MKNLLIINSNATITNLKKIIIEILIIEKSKRNFKKQKNLVILITENIT